MTSLADRFRYAYAAFKAGQAIVAAAKEVAAAVPASPASGGGLASTLPTIEQLNAATAFLNSDPRAQAIIAGAKSFAAGDAQKLIQAFKSRDWSTVEHIALTDALTVADAAGVPYAGLALKALPLFEYAAHHPHNTGEGGIGAAPEGPSTNNVSTGA